MADKETLEEIIMTQKLVERVTTLEVKHEERHNQQVEVMSRMEATQERIADSVECLVINQTKMAHLGQKTDTHDTKIEALEKTVTKLLIRQNIMWGGFALVCSGVVTTMIKVWIT